VAPRIFFGKTKAETSMAGDPSQRRPMLYVEIEQSTGWQDLLRLKKVEITLKPLKFQMEDLFVLELVHFFASAGLLSFIAEDGEYTDELEQHAFTSLADDQTTHVDEWSLVIPKPDF